MCGYSTWNWPVPISFACLVCLYRERRVREAQLQKELAKAREDAERNAESKDEEVVEASDASRHVTSGEEDSDDEESEEEEEEEEQKKRSTSNDSHNKEQGQSYKPAARNDARKHSKEGNVLKIGATKSAPVSRKDPRNSKPSAAKAGSDSSQTVSSLASISFGLSPRLCMSSSRVEHMCRREFRNRTVLSSSEYMNK